jgi:hypothetical protein
VSVHRCGDRRLQLAGHPAAAAGAAAEFGAGRLMQAKRLAGRALVAALAFAVAEPRGEGSDGSALLAEANARWSGARCRIRYDIEIKEGRDREGWSRSRIMLFAPAGEKPFNVIFEVSDRAALAAVLRDGRVPAATDFIGEGWRLAEPEKGRGLYLELRFAAAPAVHARWWFIGRGHVSADSFPVERLDQVERYMRIEAFAIASADQRFPTAPPSPAAPAASTPSPAAPAGPVTFAPTVRVVAVAAQPPSVSAGSEVDLILTYVVAGLPPGSQFEVVERREIVLDGQVLGSFDQRQSRAADTYTTSQRVRIPVGASPGLYSVRGAVKLAGIEANGSGLLEVK